MLAATHITKVVNTDKIKNNEIKLIDKLISKQTVSRLPNYNGRNTEINLQIDNNNNVLQMLLQNGVQQDYR